MLDSTSNFAKTALPACDRTNSTEVSEPDKAWFPMKNTEYAILQVNLGTFTGFAGSWDIRFLQ